MNREDFENEIEIEEAENEFDNESELTDAEPTEENSLVPAYTKEDFLTGVKPFEWIYQHKDNKLQYAQYTELMKAKAKEVGISNFMTLFKAYLETMGTISTASYDNVTEFSGQPFQLNCGAWECDDYGVYGRNMFGGEVEACNHPIMPVRRLTNVDTDTEKIVLAFKKRGKEWKTIIADRKTISSTNSIISLADYGIAVNSENARNLIKYLAEVENLNLDVIPELKSVSRLGFIGEHGFSPYSEGLVFDGDSLYGEFYKSVAKEKGNCEKSIELLNSLRESNVITRLYIHIADGNKELIGELYQRNYGILHKLAYRYYTLYSDRCICAGVTLDDMMNECYFAVYTAAKSYAKGTREFKFVSYLRYATLQYFQQMAGTRTERQRKEPLNSCKSLDVPIEGTEGLTLADTIEDIDAEEKADALIDRLAYGEVFPEVKRVLADEPEQYNTIYAIYHNNISPSEWARMKDVPLQTIRNQREKAFRELRKPRNSKYLHSLYEDIIGLTYYMGGLKKFNHTHTSCVEWAVIQIDNRV